MPDLSNSPSPTDMPVADWIPFPIEAADFRLTMGLQAISEAEWLYPGPDGDHQMAERARLLSSQADQVLACQPEAESASGVIWQMATGAPLALTGTAALLALGHAAQEDFCIMQKPEGADSYQLTGAILCFPNRWRLADKLSQGMPGIHRPVPGYDTSLQKPIDRFFEHLKPGRITARHNWSLHADDTLFHPNASDVAHDQAAAAVTAENAGEQVFMRVERQTLRRVEDVGLPTILFTIRTMVAPLGDMVAGKPGRVAALDQALTTMPQDMQRYKSMASMIPAIRGWLDHA